MLFPNEITTILDFFIYTPLLIIYLAVYITVGFFLRPLGVQLPSPI